MIPFPLLNKILVFLIDAIGIWLGGMVFYSNPKGRMNRIFLAMVGAMFFWVNFA